MGSQVWGRAKYFRQVRRCGFAFALTWLLGVGVIPARAQSYLQSVGVPPFTTQLPVENGFINAANGNLHLEIPFGSFPQRAGHPDKIVLMYDSDIWSKASGTWQPNNITNTLGGPSWGGWRIVTSREAGYDSYGETDSGWCTATNDYYWATYSPWIWVAPDGTQHSFPVATKAPLYPGTCGSAGSGTPSASGYASDGSGFYISITNYTSAVVYAPDGTKIGGAYASEDSNGNYVPYTSYSFSNNVNTWTYSDTVGRTILTEKNTNGSNVYTFTVPDFQGGNATYTVTLQGIPVDTNFGSGDYSGTMTIVGEVDLPDTTKYVFGYDYGSTPGYYGLLNAMDLPTGGQITYSFANWADSYGNLGRWITGRTTPDIWSYGQSHGPTCSSSAYVDCQQYFTLQKPIVPPNSNSDQTVYTFTLNGGAWPTEVRYYDHAAGLLATTDQCFSFVTVTNGTCSYSVTAASPATNVHLLARTTTLPVPGSSVSATTEYSWDNYGNATQISEWNFGSSPANAADRRTTLAFMGWAPYPANNIIDRLYHVSVYDQKSNLVRDLSIAYDQFTLSNVTGAPNHDDANYGTGNNARGNLTQELWSLGGSNNWGPVSFTYDMTGQNISLSDPKNNTTNSYWFCYCDVFPYKITNALGQSLNSAHDFYTSLFTSTSDLNSQTTSYSYDNMGRPTTTTYPDRGWTLMQYPSANEIDAFTGMNTTTPTSSCPASNSNGSCRQDQTLLDSLGRVSSQLVVSDPEGKTTIKTVYDSNGRVQSVSNPYRSTTENTYGVTQYNYDGLDRLTKVIDQDGSAANTYYGASVGSNGGASSQLCSGFGLGYPILHVDEAGKKRQTWTDAFGRLIEADEPDTNGNLSVGSCYAYDPNNKLIGVLSLGGTLSTCTGFNYTTYTNVNYNRCYGYDLMSRLTQKTEPETGTTYYCYTALSSGSACAGGSPTASLCSGDSSEVCARTDARGRTTYYGYDVLNRLTSKSYSDGTVAAGLSYDQSTVWGSFNVSNPLGRLTNLYANGQTSEAFSYDVMGRIKANQQEIYNNAWSSFPAINYGYDLAGNMTSYSNGAGVTFTQTFDTAGRITGLTSSWVDAQHPTTLATTDPTYGYFSTSQLGVMTLGNNLTQTNAYGPMLQPPCRIDVNSSKTFLAGCGDSVPTGNLLNFAYIRGASGSNNGNVTRVDTVGFGQNFSRTLAYDTLNRLSTFSSTSDPSGCTGLSWSYDVFGNRKNQNVTGGSCNSWSATYNAKNQITGYGYDAAGSLTSDGTHNYIYDAENRIIQVDGTAGNCATATACYVYDGAGRRVQKTVGGVATQYLYDLTGDTVAEYQSGAFSKEYAYFNGQLLAQYSGGTTYFVHTDALGSVRLLTGMNQSSAECDDYLPFGEQLSYSSCTNTGIGTHKFTGYERDSQTGSDYAFARYYGSRYGSFLSTDPMGSDPSDPQSLNRYPYVRNNPVTLTDPSGMGDCGDFCGPCDPVFGCGPEPPCFFGCGGGDGGGGEGPQPPIYTPPGGTSPNPPNGTLTSDDPFSGETNGIPSGLQIPTLGLAGLLMPGNPGCDVGSCAGANSFDGGELSEGLGILCAAQPWTCELFAISVTVYGVAILAHHYGVDAAAANALRPIFQARSEQRLVDYVARKYCVDRNQLGRAIEEEKSMSGRGPRDNLTRQEIEEIAKTLPKIPGCTPQG